MRRGLVLAVLVPVLAGCPRRGDRPRAVEPARRDATDHLLPADDAGPVTLPDPQPLPAVPAGLPTPPEHAHVTPQAVAFGELLFHDGRLASDGKTSCASCHDPAHGYAGGIDKAADGKPNLRRTPTLVNLAWARELGWDGRYRTLEQHLPVHLRGQLGTELAAAAHRIAEVPVYRAHLARLGGAPEDAVLEALEAFVLTRYEGDSAWDRVERSPDAPAELQAGYRLFTGKAQCAVCHPPPLYTDLGYHRDGRNRFADKGRGLVDPAHDRAFKTPTLRGAAARPSLFHDGSADSLAAAIAGYLQLADGADVDPVLGKLHLSPGEQEQLLAFVRALTSAAPPPTKPVLP